MASDKTKLDTVPLNPPGVVSEQPVSVSRLRELAFCHMQEGLVIMDENGLHVDVNTAFCAMTGFSEGELIGSGPEHSYWPPEERDNASIYLAKILSGSFDEIDSIFTHKGGGRYPVHINPFLITDSNDTTTYYAITVSETTARVDIEVALRESEVRYRELFESAGDAIVIMDDDKIIDFNKRTQELYGYSPDRITSDPTESFFPPTQPNGQDSREFFAEKVEASRSGIPQRYEWTGRDVNGKTVSVDVTLTTFTRGGKLHTQSITRDITQRKQIEGELQNSELRFRTLFENAGDAIVILKDFQIVDCNERSLQLFGRSRDEMLSNPTAEYFPPTQPNGQNSREYFAGKVEASSLGVPQVFEWTGEIAGGISVESEVTMTTMMIDGKPYTQSIMRDITKRKQMETALIDLNKTLEERVLQRTEELENACAELLQRGVQYRALAAKLTQAENEERKRIARLLHDNHQQLLVAAKFKMEMLQSNSYDSEVNDTTRQVLEILDQAVEITRSLTMELAPPILYGSGLVVAIQWLARWMGENHQLEVDVLGSLPSTPISTDVSSVLLRAVREVLFNVIKHSGVRQACVNIALADHQLLLSVRDEGAGFNVADSLDSLDSFGLLSIQEQLTLFNGRLDVRSALGQGTIITLSIPLTSIYDPPAEVSSVVNRVAIETTHTQRPLRDPIRILVADDHAVARSALVQILTQIQDFEVIGQAVDGLDAIEKTRMLIPDLILMDVSMPGLNGVEATRAIMTEFPGIKVIGLSMHGSEEMQSQMLAAGAACYLQKLAPVDDLFVAIRGLMA